MNLRPLLLALVFLLPTLLLQADEVHLKTGGTVVGTVIDEGDPVIVKTVGGGTIKIAREKIDSIEIKPLPPATSPDAPPSHARKPAPPVRFADLLNGWAIKPPAGWRKITTAKNSKATFALPDPATPFKLDIWIVKSEGDLAAIYQTFLKSYKTGFKDYVLKSEKGMMLGTLPAKEFVGTFTDEKGRSLSQVHAIAAGEKGTFYVVFFTGNADQQDALLPELEKSFTTFEVLPKPELSDADMKAFIDAYTKALQAAQEGDDVNAISEFDRCAALLPKHADTHMNLAVLAVKTDNTKRAIEEYTTLTKLRPDDPQAAMDLGTVLFKANRFPDALAAFQKALDLWPDFVDAWINIGAVHSQIAEYEQAIKAFKTALDIDPKCVSAWFNLGNVEHARNHYDEARKAFEAVIKIQPDHSGAKEELKKLKQEGH